MKKLFILDGNAILHRAYHALPPFKSTKGETTNAIFGFTSMILRMMTIYTPDCLAVAFDRKAPTFRHVEYADYKATRAKPPEDLYTQLPRIKEMVEAFQIPMYEMDGYEADDILGTIAEQMKSNPDIETYIVTGDMDALQLIDEKTFVLTPHKGFQESIIYDAKKVVEKYGITPEQMVDFKGLHGDTSDNIPGVHGIGEKIAAGLLQKFGTIENIYEHLDELPKSQKEKLTTGKESAFFSKKLATIIKNAPISFDMSECKTHLYNREKILQLFEVLEFRSLQRRLQEFENKFQDRVVAESGLQPSLF